MAVNYKAVAKKNPSNQTAPAKYYAQVKSSGDATLRQLAKDGYTGHIVPPKPGMLCH